jgi:hypothetical protein
VDKGGQVIVIVRGVVVVLNDRTDLLVNQICGQTDDLFYMM